MSAFRFESAYAFWLLLLVPLLYFLNLFLTSQYLRRLKKTLGEKNALYLTSSLSVSARRVRHVLELLFIVFLIFAYARPQTGEGVQKVKNEGVEIVLMVDVSNSMLADDIKPSRLDLAKRELERFIVESGGDRFAIVAFAGSAVLLTPMTSDQDALKMFIDSLSPDSVSSQGTVIKKALDEAENAFKRGGVTSDDENHVTRAIVIASDGEDQEPGAMEAAEKLAQEGYRIFTLAFGTEKGGAIPIFDDRRNVVGFKRDKQGQVILTKTTGTVLKDLAKAGGGSFHHASLQGDVVAKLKQDIDKLEKSEFESGQVRNYQEEYQPILFLAICIGLLELVLGERRGAFRIWKGRFEVGES